MNKIMICSCGRKKANPIPGIVGSIYCSTCGDKIKFMDPPIVGVYVETEQSSNSYKWVSLRTLKEALDGLEGKNDND